MEINGKRTAVEQAIGYLNSRGYMQGIQRRQVQLNMEDALAVVAAIGKRLEPRFVIDEVNREIYENCLRWMHADPNGKCQDPTNGQWQPIRLNKGLYICGTSGTGKTMLFDVLRLYARAFGLTFLANGFEKPLSWDNVRTDFVVDKYAESGNAKEYKQKFNICFQDLGSEPKEALFMGNRIELMRQIIEDRGDNHSVITHFTSNIPIGRMDAMKSIYGERVVSRLYEMCNYYEMRGRDRRKLV